MLKTLTPPKKVYGFTINLTAEVTEKVQSKGESYIALNILQAEGTETY